MVISRWRFALTGLAALLMVAAHSLALTQERSGGQFYVRAYEDRNGSGIREAGEPLITRGIAVDLLDASGTVIASALIDNAPTATQGYVGFQYLPAGEYTAVVTSAYFSATTASAFTATIDPTAPPTVVEFGGQRIAAAPPTPIEAVSAEEAARQETIRRAVAGLGALTVIGAMTCFGLIVYGVVLRPRIRRARLFDLAQTTGSMRPVDARSTQTTGSLPRIPPEG
ncbi:MAG: hypothetical protein SF162_20055 [bacterium]|nr:hypothetical protein [bacterium]